MRVKGKAQVGVFATTIRQRRAGLTVEDFDCANMRGAGQRTPERVKNKGMWLVEYINYRPIRISTSQFILWGKNRL